jgi:hypothetical protein
VLVNALSRLGATALLLGTTFLFAACAADTGSDEATDKSAGKVEAVQEIGGELQISKQSPEHITGTFKFREMLVRFDTEVLEGSRETTFELRGMMLTVTQDIATGVFDTDGFTTESGEDTSMTDADRKLIQAFDKAIGELSKKAAHQPAVDALVRGVTMFGDYSDSLPLTRTFLGRLDEGNVGSGVNLCNSVNKAGQGLTAKYSRGTHDCLSSKGDCPWWGCDGGEDNASIDYILMSMHPSGPCGDSTWFGNTSGSHSCFEPDHPSDHEYSYGACMGRCGATCGSGTVFSAACRDHDTCVSFGHSSASPQCDDDLVNAAWDALTMSNCSGVDFQVDYNWASYGNNPSCPTSWQNTNDGCDVNCQFVDLDCFR